MEPILKRGAKNLNQRLDGAGVRQSRWLVGKSLTGLRDWHRHVSKPRLARGGAVVIHRADGEARKMAGLSHLAQLSVARMWPIPWSETNWPPAMPLIALLQRRHLI